MTADEMTADEMTADEMTEHRMTLEPLGDPDEDPDTDFADEHQQTVVDADEADDGEQESPSGWAGGLDRDGPP
jgi:hypothetical protein